jgi:UDP-N-acetylmuramoyl-L-alanyl-D-glutamate--2,6-diaminopimelate ligase
MKLSELIAEMPKARVLGAPNADVTAITYDSRNVTPGALFVAVSGFKVDGHTFIQQAIANGAAAVLVQADRQEKWDPQTEDTNVPIVVVDDTRSAMASLSAAFHGYPGRRMGVIGVTGTDGKTTTCWLISAVLEAAGYRTGLLSTAGCKIGERWLPNTTGFTTPEAPQVQALLADMAADGVDYAIVESTSHGLALHRLDGCEYDVGVFTNLSPDHIDFHGSLEEYKQAKGRLFAMLDEKEGGRGKKEGDPSHQLPSSVRKAAVFNVDDPAAEYFRGQTKAPAIGYGVSSPTADVLAEDVSLRANGSSFRLISRVSGGEDRLEAAVRLPGLFNVYNALAAAAMGLSQGVELKTIVDALESFSGVPGRMEYIDEGQPFKVVVDFAHAPNALRTALTFLRSQTEGRQIAVFGCIGGRDEHRRFPMGQVAGELADYTVVTNDGPFSEDPAAIMAEIARGLEAAGRRRSDDFAVIEDRREAISHAFAKAKPGDTVLLAGKGHETSIVIGKEVIPWDERQVARELLRGL